MTLPAIGVHMENERGKTYMLSLVGTQWENEQLSTDIHEKDLMDIVNERYANSIVSEYTNAWRFKTDIPHATFSIMEDDKVACYGIVFHVDDLK
jgi:hypothetical protein